MSYFDIQEGDTVTLAHVDGSSLVQLTAYVNNLGEVRVELPWGGYVQLLTLKNQGWDVVRVDKQFRREDGLYRIDNGMVIEWRDGDWHAPNSDLRTRMYAAASRNFVRHVPMNEYREEVVREVLRHIGDVGYIELHQQAAILAYHGYDS